jgi:hypothetical protein
MGVDQVAIQDQHMLKFSNRLVAAIDRAIERSKHKVRVSVIGRQGKGLGPAVLNAIESRFQLAFRA